MAGTGLLSVIDDIATVLDDVALLSKVAAKKTAGVLGDDLALNAEQVSGVKANRELPVVWAVTKGSLLNKLILVPAAIAISAFAPVLITVLLVLGGIYLCFEGCEKIFHQLLHSAQEREQQHQQRLQALLDSNVDVLALERTQVRGAIRTDFVLSAEIVVIVLGTVQQATLPMQIAVLSAMALLITFGVYGTVAAIVKLDDLGLYLLKRAPKTNGLQIQRVLGQALLAFAPKLMKLLAVVGTVAMFLVGGGIMVHSIHWLHAIVAQGVQWLTGLFGHGIQTVAPALFDMAVGAIVGTVALLLMSAVGALVAKRSAAVQ